jgi:hypothetical protein
MAKIGMQDFFVGSRRFYLFNKVPSTALHADQHLDQPNYKWVGTLPTGELREGDLVVSIDADAYRQRHEGKGSIVKLRTGSYKRHGRNIALKLMGVIRCNQLYIVTDKAGEFVEDISDTAPVRVSGLKRALRIARRRTEENKQLPLNV